MANELTCKQATHSDMGLQNDCMQQYLQTRVTKIQAYAKKCVSVRPKASVTTTLTEKSKLDEWAENGNDASTHLLLLLHVVTLGLGLDYVW